MTAGRDDAHRDDAHWDDANWEDTDEFGIGPAGVPFPGEPEWLELQLPDGDDQSDDFVQRTMRSLADEGLAVPTAEPGSTGGAKPDPLRPELLAAFRAPDPTPDFVERTLAVLQQNRRSGFRDLLARHAVPDPSPQFVARTLAALDGARTLAARDVARTRSSRITRVAVDAARWLPNAAARWTWPLVAIAAGAALWFVLRTAGPDAVDRSAPFAPHAASPFAYEYAPTRLPAVLAAVSRRQDPDALSDSGVDGAWLFIGDMR